MARHFSLFHRKNRGRGGGCWISTPIGVLVGNISNPRPGGPPRQLRHGGGWGQNYPPFPSNSKTKG